MKKCQTEGNSRIRLLYITMFFTTYPNPSSKFHARSVPIAHIHVPKSAEEPPPTPPLRSACASAIVTGGDGRYDFFAADMRKDILRSRKAHDSRSPPLVAYAAAANKECTADLPVPGTTLSTKPASSSSKLPAPSPSHPSTLQPPPHSRGRKRPPFLQP